MTTEVAERPSIDPAGSATDADDATADEPTVLRPAAITASREQERLRLVQGKTGIAALLAGIGPKLRHLGSPEAARDGLRYRPVAWTVIAVVAVAAFLPGRAERAPAEQAAISPSPVVTTVTPTTPPPVTDDTLPAIPSGPTPTFSPPTTSSFSPPTTSSFSPPTTSAAPPTTTSGPPLATALTIRGSGWATRVPPGAVPSDDIPEGTLPVANRLGQVDRVSFIRLAGTAGTLRLTEDDAGAREALGAGQIAICPILVSDWAEEEGQSFADAPAWSTDSCVGSTESDGVWTFDLQSFPFRTGPAGFALVPTGDAPADFQVTFKIR